MITPGRDTFLNSLSLPIDYSTHALYCRSSQTGRDSHFEQPHHRHRSKSKPIIKALYLWTRALMPRFATAVTVAGTHDNYSIGMSDDDLTKRESNHYLYEA